MVCSCVHVLKLEMADLQVGHLRFLHDMESPYVVESDQQDTADLLLAALICSMRWRDAAKHVGRWYLKPFLRFWSWRCRKCNLIFEAANFRKYLSDAISTPKIKKANGGKALKSPLHQRLYLMLVEDIGHDPERAWDLTVREAIDLWVARAEKQGALEFFSETEEAHIRLHREMNERWMAQRRQEQTEVE